MPTGVFASGTSATASAIVPAGSVAGEEAFFVVGSGSLSRVLAAPDSTWSFINTVRSGTSSSHVACYMAHKTLTTDDVGDTVSASLSTSGSWCAVVITVGSLRAAHPVLRSVNNLPLPTPTLENPTVEGTSGSTTYSYVITSLNEAGESTQSSPTTITTGPATLTSTNYIKVRFGPVQGANNYNVYGRALGGPYQLIGTCDNTNLGSSSADQLRGIDDTGQTPTAQTPPANYPQNIHWDCRDADNPGRLTTNFANSKVIHATALITTASAPSAAITGVPSGFTLLGQIRHSANRIVMAVCLEDFAPSGDLLSGRLGAFNTTANNWAAISALLRPSAANGAPLAIAGIDYTGFGASPVYLDGGLSYDLDEDDLSYSWSQLSGPSATLTGSNTVTPSYTAPATDATQMFRLTVSDSGSLTDTDDVTVSTTSLFTSTENVAPLYKSATTANFPSGTSHSITLPDTSDGAAVDDFAVLVAAANPGTITPPADWDLLPDAPTTATNKNGRLYVWTKTLEAADLGASLALTLNSSSRSAIACLTTDGAVIHVSAVDTPNAQTTTSVAPSVDPTADDSLLVVIHGVNTWANGTVPTWTPDTATTERVDVASANGSTPNATLMIATETLTSSATTGTRTATASADVQSQGISLVLTSTDTPPSPTDTSAFLLFF